MFYSIYCFFYFLILHKGTSLIHSERYILYNGLELRIRVSFIRTKETRLVNKNIIEFY